VEAAEPTPVGSSMANVQSNELDDCGRSAFIRCYPRSSFAAVPGQIVVILKVTQLAFGPLQAAPALGIFQFAGLGRVNPIVIGTPGRGHFWSRLAGKRLVGLAAMVPVVEFSGFWYHRCPLTADLWNLNRLQRR